jgi:hypothetical protein
LIFRAAPISLASKPLGMIIVSDYIKKIKFRKFATFLLDIRSRKCDIIKIS